MRLSSVILIALCAVLHICQRVGAQSVKLRGEKKENEDEKPLKLLLEAELPKEVLPQEPLDITRKSVPPGVKLELDEEFVEELTDAMENSPTELIVDLGEEETEAESNDGDEDGDEDGDKDKKGRRLQALATSTAVLGYRPPLVTTVGGCAATRFGCCGYATVQGVVNANLARIDRFGSNCPFRQGAFLDVCRRQRFGCCSRATGFNVPCSNRLCTNDVLYVRRPVAATAVATATATAAIAAPRRVVTPRFVATPYPVGYVGGLAPRPAVATATATAVAGAGRPLGPLVAPRRFAYGYGGPLGYPAGLGLGLY